MARTLAELPKGTRLTDHISLGVIAKTFPITAVEEVLQQTGRTSKRHRALPMHVVVYYVIALARRVARHAEGRGRSGGGQAGGSNPLAARNEGHSIDRLDGLSL